MSPYAIRNQQPMHSEIGTQKSCSELRTDAMRKAKFSSGETLGMRDTEVFDPGRGQA